MVERMNEERIVESLGRAREFELPDGAARRDISRVREMLAGGDTAASVKHRGIWRAVMTNRWTRYASAAVVIIGVAIGLKYAGDTPLSATELLTKVAERMEEAAWLKGVSKTYGPGEDEPGGVKTSFTDFANKQAFLIYDSGYLHRLDYAQMHWSIYSPVENTIIVKELSGTWTGPGTQVLEYVEKLGEEGIEVRQSHEQRDGVKVTIVEFDEVLNNLSTDPNGYMSKMMMGRTTVKTIKTRLEVDAEQLRLGTAEMRYYDPNDELIVTIEGYSEVVETGPADIYELGAPRDAEVIRKVRDAEVKRVREKIDEHQKGFLKDYVAVQVEVGIEEGKEDRLYEAMVIYSDGEKLRVDVFGRLYEPKDAIVGKHAGLVADSLERVKPYCIDPNRLMLRSVRVYDGLWQHILDWHEGEYVLRTPQRRPDGDMYGDDDIDDFGWRQVWWLNEPEHMYSDAFSEGSGLIAMELTSQWNGHQLPKRLVLHVDPAKDYLVRRYSSEVLLDAAWQIEVIDPNVAEEKGHLRQEVRVYDVVEYGRTSEGQWYPKVTEITGWDQSIGRNKYRSEFNRESRIYLLEENPELPEAMFDPGILE